MEHKGTKTIETERLILRAFRAEDAEAMFRNWASDPEVTKFLTWPAHGDVSVTRHVLADWVGRYGESSYYDRRGDAEEIWKELYEKALAVQNGRKISNYVDAGGVAAAILTASGNIYTGVCVDTCSSLGLCAERNAMFHMLTNGEHEIRKVLAIMPDGRTGAPCGACRELMAQLMPDSYRDIEVMLDYERKRTATLGELTPEWWI